MAVKFMKLKKIKLGRYFFEFVSMFFAVIAAFGLNNWNENRRDDRAEEKILTEISNGLNLDLIDFQANKRGHKNGLSAGRYFKNILAGVPVSFDSILYQHVYLTGDNISIINVSGYEALKSKGLEIIKNDSIRSQIISIYENDYRLLKSYEENSPMDQAFQNYYFPIENILAEYFLYDEKGRLTGIKTPLILTLKENNLILSHLLRLRISRTNKLYEYNRIEEKVKKLLEDIEQELENR